MADLAVIILNYNGKPFLEKFLPAVLAHSRAATVYVIDNCSTDESRDFVAEHFSDIQLIVFTENLGYASGYNRALYQIKEKYAVLLNSDVEVTSDWLSPMLSYMEEHPNAAACQPKILDYNNRDFFEYAGGSGGFIDTLGYPYCRGRVFDTIEKDEAQYDDTCQVFWASGACLFVRTTVFIESGGFDADFFAHMEEIDLCWRLRKLGHEIYCVPGSTVYHVGGGTLDKSNATKTYLNFRNNLVMMGKNESLGNLLWKLPLRFLLDWLAALKFLTGSGISHFFAIFHAHFSFVLQIPSIVRKRKRVRHVAFFTITKKINSLPVQYYLFNRKKYSDIHKW